MQALTNSSFQRYLESLEPKALLERLEVSNMEALLEAIEHFTEREAEKRDKILLSYLGQGGVNLIVDSICNRILASPTLKDDAQIVDVGAGSGLFTVRVARNLHTNLPKACFYAMDVTPIMLKLLHKKSSQIRPFFGVAENIIGSAKLAERQLKTPAKFDAIYSTLMLHHCSNVEKVFQSMRDALKTHGKALVVDLCEHPFKEFREEMGDIHLGFDPAKIERNAEKFFAKVSVEKLPGICCSSSGRCAELFIAYMKA